MYWSLFEKNNEQFFLTPLLVLKIFEYTEKIRMVFLELYCLIIVVVAPISSFLFNKTKQILRKILVRQIICLTNNKHGFSSLYDIDDDLR